jgi:drug/metabolite transporter (DMT)-like permease
MQQYGEGKRIAVVSAPVLAAATASVITGTALVATRFIVSSSDGLTVATFRYVVAAICLLILVPLVERKVIAPRDFAAIAALGVLYFCFFPWCISSAMEFTTASSGAIMLACTPAVTLLLGQITGREQWSASKAIGVIFAILGVSIAIGGTRLGLDGPAWRGNVLMILATLFGAVYAIFSKPYLDKYSPLTVTATAMAAGAVGLLCLWAPFGISRGIPHFDSARWLSVFYIGAVGGALSFFLYAWALGQTAPTVTMIFLPLNPIAAVVTGALFLSEPLSLDLLLGLALVIIGILLVVGFTERQSLKLGTEP